MLVAPAVLLIFGLGYGLAADQEQDQSNRAHCLQRLRAPDYPPLAVQARLSGEVTADISLDQAGKVVGVEFVGKPHPLLVRSVGKAVESSTFAPMCEGQKITLLFSFVIDGQGTNYRSTPLVSFGFPNRIWIVSAPLENVR